MHVGIRAMRWVFAGLYILAVGTSAGWLVINPDRVPRWGGWILLAGVVVTQAVFLIGVGQMNLCAPMRKRRLIAPVFIAGFMMAILIAGLLLALSELFKCNNMNETLCWGLIALSWVVWSIIFFVYTRKSEKYKAIARMVGVVMVGSWLQLLVTVPSHVLVSRRPGCLVGLGTGIGICAGIVVMVWAFGPGIWLMFLREKRDSESAV